MSRFDAGGWSGVEIGSEYEAVKASLAASKIAFEEAKLHKDGTRLLKPKRAGFTSNTIYFEWNATEKTDRVSQLTFVKENASQSEATRALTELEKQYGPAAEKTGPRAMDSSTETTRVWKNPKTTLKLTVRLYKDGTMSVFENWGRPS